MDDNKKCKRISFTCSPELFEQIKERSETYFGGKTTKYIVHKLSQDHNSQALNSPSRIRNNPVEFDRIELYKLIKEVNKIGTNINQIAHKTNLGFRRDQALKEALDITQEKLDHTVSTINQLLQLNNPNFK
ncbi:plasmid mobilization relaxosome protein MobC [Croceivirga sp. JEA036]|uniref:plasmid mobilization relaxosome protein MobC n=1 Tax=Croceivirga sp. JEA036 TaxID=2721162 RepID=UPI00169F1685|nr:plasmid mobilization relaxosome protein MobC [Croceivirga sp. JEA036]NJB38142.1 MobC family plasmid mobilization relaxosome protein [Croceivirga sp. JEA036]